MQGWFLAQYVIDPARPRVRNSAINSHTAAIVADGGKFAARECLGNQEVVGVGGVTAATLLAINQDPLVRRFPGVNQLSDNLGVLTAAQWTNYRDFAISLGYLAADWDATFPLDKSNYTLRDVIVFMLKKRLTPRFDGPSKTIVFDGAQVNQPASTADAIAAAIV